MANILIAEDEPDIRELVRITLQFFGHVVTPTSDGAKALDAFRANRYDIVVMDVRMPNMTGYEACREMRKLEDRTDIPIIFLSAKGQESEIQEGLDAGANAYLLKPFSPDELIDTIQTLLAESVIE